MLRSDRITLIATESSPNLAAADPARASSAHAHSQTSGPVATRPTDLSAESG